jgi:hypothetical protein
MIFPRFKFRYLKHNAIEMDCITIQNGLLLRDYLRLTGVRLIASRSINRITFLLSVPDGISPSRPAMAGRDTPLSGYAKRVRSPAARPCPDRRLFLALEGTVYHDG